MARDDYESKDKHESRRRRDSESSRATSSRKRGSDRSRDKRDSVSRRDGREVSRERGNADGDKKRRGGDRDEVKDDRDDRDKDRRHRERSRGNEKEGDDTSRSRDHTRGKDRDRDRDTNREKYRESRSKHSSSRVRSKSRSRSPIKRSDDRKRSVSGVEMSESEADAGLNGAQVQSRIPLSLGDLMKKKEEKEQLAKPVFLTKAQRAEIALKKRQEEVKAQREKQEELKQAHVDLLSKAREEYSEVTGRRGGGTTGTTGTDIARGITEGIEIEIQTEVGIDTETGIGMGMGDRTEKIRLTVLVPKELEAEQRAIKERYIGATKQKRRVRRMNEKKFTFDWDDADDTGADHNSLYSDRHHVHAMFGRGHMGGIDVRQQRKEADAFYSDFLGKRRTDDENSREVERVKAAENKAAKMKHDERHWSQKPLAQMAERDWRIFREDFNISTRGGNIPHPWRSWEESPLPDNVKEVIAQIGYKEPSPIQRQALPVGLQNRDIVGIAETGSGKTAAFLIPMLTWITSLPPRVQNPNDAFECAPYAVILAPTRELAQQIEEECEKFAKPLGITAVAIIGGADMQNQGSMLKVGVDIVVATPGRLKDMLENRYLVLTKCTYVVMDEADRMIDMGFEAEVQAILDYMPVTNTKPEDDEKSDGLEADFKMGTETKFRQTIMFSATMPPSVERLSRKYLRKPAHVIIGTAGKAVDRVEQRVEMMSDSKKRKRIAEILQSGDIPTPIIVFVNQKKGCDMLAKGLDKMGYRSVTLHGGKNQEQRQSALQDFKDGHADILVATDVAGRGLDVKDVGGVINYDMAKNIQDYTHRIGRTGRAGKTGIAITFLTPEDGNTYYDLKQMLIASSVSTCPSALSAHAEAQHKPGTVLNKRKKEETLLVK
ncbi:hypothetical protein SARC_07099 [Sphaeroforma arctica JP610]|uniref:RNA helicase n=1 Tax=Sphaeroforma arctica JP610 TaxID=667725 RepID=A0A0L0FUL8_9EUKA|nr:hypothetical protein SARC_07099 [Sphaeroforma arctica JP610]KNC80527.1 hypothetical protein SARC_07099 [Sphaeroforma arctica JP610]|eukprot:XP_014154429.1 hypothetical protein SARC_07099 [Sphaeroforma arctica JP610]